MKKLLFVLALALEFPIAVFSQTVVEQKQTTFEKFTSTIGHIVKFKDYRLPDVKEKVGIGMFAVYYTVHVDVRQVMIGDQTSLFLRLSYKENQNSPERYAFIAYEDVIEIDKALKELVEQGKIDNTGDADYLENKFKTKDNFEIGYYINKIVSKKGETSYEKRWYMDLDRRYSGSSTFFPSSEVLENLFTGAINKMESLR